jgi:hypothetical protein
LNTEELHGQIGGRCLKKNGGFGTKKTIFALFWMVSFAIIKTFKKAVT